MRQHLTWLLQALCVLVTFLGVQLSLAQLIFDFVVNLLFLNTHTTIFELQLIPKNKSEEFFKLNFQAKKKT